MAKHTLHKLSPRFYDPFRINGRVGAVAYRLQLPEESRIHVFHVSLFKPQRSDLPPTLIELPSIQAGKTLPDPPFSVLRARWFKGQRQLLVQWSADGVDNATWEDFEVST